MQELTRTQILEGNYTHPTDHVKLIPTKCFMNRLEEKGLELDCIPTLLKVTKENIHSGKTEDGETLKSVVVRIKYSSRHYMFLCLNPYDGAVKTLWFRKRNNYGDRRRKKRIAITVGESAVQDNRVEDNIG